MSNTNEFAAILRWVLLLLPLTSWAYYILAIFSADRFSRVAVPVRSSFTPPVSILKPVRGLDPQAYENFASFCHLDYPDYELLFCVAHEADPAVPVIRRIIADFPRCCVRLLVGASETGPHDKVNKLARMEREAASDVLWISDSDVRVQPSLLRQLVDPLKNQTVAAVTSLYRSLAEPSLGTALEVLGITTDFFPGVLTACRLGGPKFTLGHTVILKRKKLAEIGGFEAIADCYAEDYELGARLAAKGGQIVLSPEVPEIAFPAISLSGFLRRQLRSNLAIRSARPWGYAGMMFTYGLPMAVAASFASSRLEMALLYVSAYLLLRTVCAWRVGVVLVGDKLTRRSLWLLPVYDALAFIMWLVGFRTRRVNWRGTVYEVRHGRMQRVAN